MAFLQQNYKNCLQFITRSLAHFEEDGTEEDDEDEDDDDEDESKDSPLVLPSPRLPSKNPSRSAWASVRKAR